MPTAEAVSYPPFGDARHRRVSSGTSKRAEPRPSGYRSLHLVYSYRAALKHALDALRRTYPNYFTNLLQFRRLMRGALA